MESPRSGAGARGEHHAWSLVGTGGALFFQWMLLALVARTGGPTEAGRFALALAVTGPVMLLAGLGLRHAQIADAMVAERLPVYLRLRGLAVGVGLGAIALVAAFGPFDRATSVALLLMGLAKAVEAGGEVTYGYLQRRGRFDLVARSQLGRGLLGFLGMATGMLVGGLGGGLVGLCAGWLCGAAMVDVPNLRREAPGVTLGRAAFQGDLRRLLETTLPLGVVALLWSTALNLPRYFLEGLHGPSALGVFAAAASLIVPAGAVANALGQSGGRTLALRLAEGDSRAMRERWWWAAAVGSGLGLLVLMVGWALGPWLLRSVFGAAFALSRAALMPFLLAGAAGAAATVFDYLLLAAGRFRTQLALGAVVWLTTAVASGLWVTDRGVQGAAHAIAFSAAVHLVVAGWAAWALGAGEPV